MILCSIQVLTSSDVKLVFLSTPIQSITLMALSATAVACKRSTFIHVYIYIYIYTRSTHKSGLHTENVAGGARAHLGGGTRAPPPPSPPMQPCK